MSSLNMALSVERSALDAALKRVSDTLAKKPVIPVTGCVWMCADNDELVLRTTDLERQTITVIPATVDRPGTICLSGEALRGIVSGFAAGAQVRLEADATSGRCVVASGRSRYRLAIEPADQHPDLGAADGTSFDIPGRVLKNAINRVSFAAATMQDRPHLWGAHLHIVQHEGRPYLALVAIDGIVFSRQILELPASLTDMPGVTIPTEALATLARMAPDDGDIRLTVSESLIGAIVGENRFVSKLVEGKFVDYQRLLPQLSGRSATVDRGAMAAALNRFGAIDEKGAGISVQPGDNVLILSGAHASIGDAREEVEAEIQQPDFGFGVSRARLAPVLSKFAGEHVLFDQQDPSSPIRVLGVSDADRGHDALLMPMRISASGLPAGA